MQGEKTIAAISTGFAPGGIGIVRISGKDAKAVADQVFRGKSGKKISEMAGYTAGPFFQTAKSWTMWWLWYFQRQKAIPVRTWWSFPATEACM